MQSAITPVDIGSVVLLTDPHRQGIPVAVDIAPDPHIILVYEGQDRFKPPTKTDIHTYIQTYTHYKKGEIREKATSSVLLNKHSLTSARNCQYILLGWFYSRLHLQ